jgi:hypothetical protein
MNSKSMNMMYKETLMNPLVAAASVAQGLRFFLILILILIFMFLFFFYFLFILLFFIFFWLKDNLAGNPSKEENSDSDSPCQYRMECFRSASGAEVCVSWLRGIKNNNIAQSFSNRKQESKAPSRTSKSRFRGISGVEQLV